MITSRKADHVRLAIAGDVGFRNRTNGLDKVVLPYCALPELDVETITTQVEFAGRTLWFPMIISGMTGGYPDAAKINEDLAWCAAELGIAMGVGSMRSAFQDTNQEHTYTVVRKFASTVPIISNIGAVQLADWHRSGVLRERVAQCIAMVDASVFGVHLNPLQELMQPEGEPRFAGVLDAIAQTVEYSTVPVLVKEVGAGISGAVASRLIGAGVSMIDVGGAGGTSWAGIEIQRRTDSQNVEEFWDVGVSTAQCLREMQSERRSMATSNSQANSLFPTVVSSGGIESGRAIAASVALGADLCASARIVIRTLEHGGRGEVVAMLKRWQLDLRRWMFITGSNDLRHLSHVLYSENTTHGV